ncbi:PEP-CTERM sorting domain-containing protein [Aeoliella sp. SH292]|uniref:PEP-CTERM sorting domain-containing protein n=1 Tax=Aeoliella sp. SH292 TaxID=3454464 RepID=UPI003F9C16EC
MNRIFYAGAALAVALFGGQVMAGNISVSYDGVATTGLAGYTTYTVKVDSDSGAINGVRASFDGAMNQVSPFGLPTIFTDNNGVIQGTGGQVSQDSQFKFASAQVLSLETAESATFLRGALTNLASFDPGSGLTLAQIVIADGASVAYSLSVDDGSGVAIDVMGTIPAVSVGPTLVGLPASGSSLSAALQAAFANRQGGPAVVADAIMVMNETGTLEELGAINISGISDSLPSISTTLVPGSALGKYSLVMDGPFDTLDPGTVITGDIIITAENAVDQALVYSFSATIPEPSSVVLSGLAVLGLAASARRRAA